MITDNNWIVLLDVGVLISLIYLTSPQGQGTPQQHMPTAYRLAHPVNFPCGRKPEKTHDLRQSVDILFLHKDWVRVASWGALLGITRLIV